MNMHLAQVRSKKIPSTWTKNGQYVCTPMLCCNFIWYFEAISKLIATTRFLPIYRARTQRPPASMATLTGWWATAFCNDFSPFSGTSSKPSILNLGIFLQESTCQSEYKITKHHITEGSIKGIEIYPVDIAFSIHDLVRVVVFSVNPSVLYDKVEGVIHEPTIAATISSIGEHSTSSYSDKVIISPVTCWLMFSTVLTTEKAEQLPAPSIDTQLITTIED
jgi:hypothetical protein